MRKSDKMNKKGGMSIAIVLLTLFTLILCTYALYMFNTSKRALDEPLVVSSYAENLYVKEVIINFYIQRIADKIGISASKGEFIENFRKELSKYKFGGNYAVSELGQTESQLKEENVNQIDGKWGIELTIKINDSANINKNDKYKAEYSYKKVFIRR